MSADEFDERVLTWMSEHRTPWATHVARTVMDFGTTSRWIGVVVLAALVVVAILRAWWVAGAVVAAVVVATVVASVLKHVIGRARPPADVALVHLSGYSMPSSEAARTAAASTALVVTATWASRRLMVACTALLAAAMVVVALCMLYLGGHWPTDVLVGWIVGGVIGLAVAAVVRAAAGRPPIRSVLVQVAS